MAKWSETLGPYKLDGIEFEATTRERRGGRALVERRYPNRDGGDQEDMGREPYTYELTIPLFDGVDPEHYPNLFDQLRAVLESPPSTLEYQDPEDGVVVVSVGAWSAALDSERRDGVVLSVTLIERQLDVANLGRTLRADPGIGDPEELAASLDDAMAEAGIDEDTVSAGFAEAGAELDLDEKGSAGTLWQSQVAETTARINDGAATAGAIVAQVERVRARLAVLCDLDAAKTAEAQPVYEAAMRLSAALEQSARDAAATAPALVEHVVHVETSVFEVAASLYGDPSRASDIIARNAMPDPLFIPAGTVLVVAER